MGRTALIIVDVQYDFLPPDGALAVPGGEEILPVIEGLLDRKEWDWDLVIASQDYHPPDHISFASSHPPHQPFSELELTDFHGKRYSQTLWPDHCIQGTKGAEIETDLRRTLLQWEDRLKIVRKGTHPQIEAYSAFEGYFAELDNSPERRTVASPESETERTEGDEPRQYLRSKSVDKVVVTGLATDYCVLQTALSAISESFGTLLIAPAVRGISAEAVNTAFDKIESLGGTVVGRRAGEKWEESVKEWIRG